MGEEREEEEKKKGIDTKWWELVRLDLEGVNGHQPGCHVLPIPVTSFTTFPHFPLLLSLSLYHSS